MTAWNHFLDEVDKARKKLCCSRSKAWFRGVGNSSYHLTPSLFGRANSPGVKREKELYSRYTREFGRNLTSWEDLADMQHSEVPTRLLDWTEVFGVALYFAISGDCPSPCIWVLNPFTLSAKARGENDTSIGVFHMDRSLDYFERFLSTGNWPFARPFPYQPPIINARIQAQRGFFTVHGHDHRPLNETCPKYVKCIPIPEAAISDARRFLSLAGFDDLAMFPDRAGFVKKLRQEYMRT